MAQLIEFSANNLPLVGTFLITLGLLLWHIIADPGGKLAVAPAQAIGLINHEDALVVDVRSMNEFKQGHVLNALNIPLESLAKQLQTLEKHKGRPIVVACRSGSRSNHACRQLRKAGFENVLNLRGGMMAWESADLPIKRKG